MSSRRTRSRCWTLLATAGLAGGCAGMPVAKPTMEQMPPSELRPGDIVQLETTDGRSFGFVVTDVTDTGIEAAGARLAYPEIAVVRRIVDGDEPICGGSEPLGCSIPASVERIAAYHEKYKSRFHDACVRHDYCYRHGYRTYGIGRASCDDVFRDDMKRVCTRSWLDFDLLNQVSENARCLLVAEELYQGVSRYGDEHFRVETSSYCEYSGAPR